MRRTSWIVLALVAVLLGTAACGLDPDLAAARRDPPVAQHVSKLLVLVLENHSSTEAVAGLPTLRGQEDRYGRATSWRAVAHPSLPNYLMLASGSTYGIRDDHPASAHPLSGQSVLGQLAEHGHPVRVYVEDQPWPCAATNRGSYVMKVNAWVYFTDPAERAACRRDDVPMGTATSGPLRADVVDGTLPTYGLMVPDLCHDGHSCGLTTTDAWLRRWLVEIEAGPDFRSGRLAVVVTFDEDDHSAGNRVATAVLAAQLHHAVVTTPFTHASLAAAPSRLVGLPPLRAAAGAPDLLAQLGLTTATAAGRAGG